MDAKLDFLKQEDEESIKKMIQSVKRLDDILQEVTLSLIHILLMVIFVIILSAGL